MSKLWPGAHMRPFKLLNVTHFYILQAIVSHQSNSLPPAGVDELRVRARRRYHGHALLLQRGGIDDSSQEPAVSDGVLLPLEALVLQLAVHQQQLAAQGLKLLPLGGA